MRRKLLVALAALVLLAGAGVAAAWWLNERETRDVRGSSTREFLTTEETTTRAEEEVESEPSPPESRTAPATLGTQPAPRWYRHSVVRTGAPGSPLSGRQLLGLHT